MTFRTSRARIVKSLLPTLGLYIIAILALRSFQIGYFSLSEIWVPLVIWLVLVAFNLIMAAISVTFEGDEVIVKKLASKKQASLSDFANAKFEKHVIIATPKTRPFLNIPRVGFSKEDWQTINERLRPLQVS